jgi:hypothetical protein
VAAFKQAELGMPVAELIRRMGISEQTSYRWKKVYSGMESDQVRDYFALLPHDQQAQSIHPLAAAGQGDHTIAQATRLSVEMIRRVLAERGLSRECTMSCRTAQWP